MNMKFAKNTSGSKGEDGVMKVKPISFGLKKKDGDASGGAGFKKGGFKSAFAKVEPVAESKTETKVTINKADAPDAKVKAGPPREANDDVQMESDDEDTDRYDPNKPTGCEKCSCSAPLFGANAG